MYVDDRIFDFRIHFLYFILLCLRYRSRQTIVIIQISFISVILSCLRHMSYWYIVMPPQCVIRLSFNRYTQPVYKSFVLMKWLSVYCHASDIGHAYIVMPPQCVIRLSLNRYTQPVYKSFVLMTVQSCSIMLRILKKTYQLWVRQ